jgi:hypothetical protein
LVPRAADIASRPHKGSRQWLMDYRYSPAWCVRRRSRAGQGLHRYSSTDNLLPNVIFQEVQVILILQKRYADFTCRICVDLLPKLIF